MEAGARDLVDDALRGLAVILLQVPSVTGVRENDAFQTYRFDDRELNLEVLVVLQIAADVGAVQDRRAVRIGRRGQGQTWTDAAELEAAQIVDAAQEEARKDRYALARRTSDVVELGVQLEHEDP